MPPDMHNEQAIFRHIQNHQHHHGMSTHNTAAYTPVEYVDIDVVSTLSKVTIQDSCKVVGPFILTALAQHL